MGNEFTYDSNLINKVLSYTRNEITKEIRGHIETKRKEAGAYKKLYDQTLEYPLRKGKMLRPALCISFSRAVGGLGESTVTVAAALELYHNAFLIKDDFEDESHMRRGTETLHRKLGTPRAINVGDATNVLAVGLILKNLSILGVGKTLHILHEIELMVRQSVEGQAMELDWRHFNTTGLTDDDYIKMCVKKTCWYTFMSPSRIGVIAGNFSLVTKNFKSQISRISEMNMKLGLAFQIQDDILNIEALLENYGKEIAGDIYEGKRTILLNHVLNHSEKRDKILQILKKSRDDKTNGDAELILMEMKRCGSIQYAKNLAQQFAVQASEKLNELDFLLQKTTVRPEENWNVEFADRRFIKEVINYVIQRNH